MSLLNSVKLIKSSIKSNPEMVKKKKVNAFPGPHDIDGTFDSFKNIA